jgi:hypothetical protein
VSKRITAGFDPGSMRTIVIVPPAGEWFTRDADMVACPVVSPARASSTGTIRDMFDADAIAVLDRGAADFFAHQRDIVRGPIPRMGSTAQNGPDVYDSRWQSQADWLDALRPCEALRSRDPGQVSP